MNESLPKMVLIPHFGIEKPIIGIEIGTSTGISAQGMLLRMPNLTLYTIDPYEHEDLAPFERNFPQDIHDRAYLEAQARLAEFGDRCKIIRKRSDDAVDDVPSQVNFVFIDGHHEYPQVISDILNYIMKVVKGGIICGHDYIQVPDVTRAVNEMFWNNEINLDDDFVWSVKL